MRLDQHYAKKLHVFKHITMTNSNPGRTDSDKCNYDVFYI